MVVKKSVACAEFWRNEERFADLFNAKFFNSEEVIKPEDLQEMDTDVSGTLYIGEEKISIERRRDVIKKMANGREFILVAIESQTEVHYAMPLRHMIYDALGYYKEYRDIASKTKGKRGLTSAEFLSKMRRDDRLHPIFTLVIYYNEKEWDGPLCLKDMMM